MGRILYELAGADPARRFSPYCWRIRMALAHKGLEADCRPWRFTEGQSLAFSGQDKVPVLVDGETVVTDSWAIATYLEAAYPDRPLFPGKPAASRFVVSWADTTLNTQLSRLIVSDIPAWLMPEHREYFRTSREARFGMTLEAVTDGREARLPGFRASLAPLRALVRAQPFLGGDQPDYGDYAVFGSLQWARCVSSLPLLEREDPLRGWRDRMLDLFGGLARAAPHCDAD
ncbi:glutathione S-transferase [Pseudoroseomonas deserti]|uniref:Glutathione S-transferase n=1 Tax=Teichococcus deserti TaxID=1817963 RepID=A0A1V2H6Z3_9PROT|nr:glutathione S-transferase family protein [Pseudoroseomonas deserti]ONG56667.1 glutathione S-transferase [Pseudoroseomonas deserti]